MLNWFLAILVHKAVITEQEAEHLSKKLADNIHPHQFKDAFDKVKEILDEIAQKK